MTRTVQAAKPLEDILEDEWDRDLFRGPKALAPMLGWTSYHTLRSKGSKAGYPDRTLVRERIIFAELKREKTQPTDEQIAWLDRLAEAGGEVYLWRPSDLDDIAAILSKRWHFFSPAHWPADDVRAYAGLGADANADWIPRSLWIPGVGRAELST
jgi:hypothetical protein